MIVLETHNDLHLLYVLLLRKAKFYLILISIRFLGVFFLNNFKLKHKLRLLNNGKRCLNYRFNYKPADSPLRWILQVHTRVILIDWIFTCNFFNTFLYHRIFHNTTLALLRYLIYNFALTIFSFNFSGQTIICLVVSLHYWPVESCILAFVCITLIFLIQ